MLTPLDIQKKDFRRSFRGYNVEEVHSFLDRINQEYDKLYSENVDLKERLAEIEHNLARYREIEEVLKNTMVMAQKNSEDLRQNAQKEVQLTLEIAGQEAQKIIQEAEYRASQIIAEAEKRVNFLLEEYHQMESQARIFRSRFRSFLEAELKLIDGEDHDTIGGKESERNQLTG